MSAPAAPAARRVCGECGEPAAADARFCEACGADLPIVPGAGPGGAEGPPDTGEPEGTPAGCRECGGEVGADGYCLRCGAKAPSERDHVTAHPQPWVAAVSDVGRRHRRNEDALAVAAEPAPDGRAVLVVCDGVSSAPRSDEASLAAARAALGVLVDPPPRGTGAPDSRAALAAAQLVRAGEAANRAVVEATAAGSAESPPSCTLAVAVVEPGRVVAGSVGDSRVYWLPDDGDAALLTVDDSWAAEQVAEGVPREVAEALPQAHAITRWLGADSPDHEPRVSQAATDGPGWVVACTDGLWNYCSGAGPLGELVRRSAATAGGDPLATASRLVDWANERGGRDNITVALARVEERRGSA